MPSESGAATTSEDVSREQKQTRPPVQEEPIADAGTEKGTPEATQAGAGASS